MSSSPTTHHKPYPPVTWSLGNPASKHDDIAPSSVFLAIFLTCLIFAILIVRRNILAGIKFRISMPLIAFSVIRTVSAILRLVLTCYPHDVSLGIAAQIFVVAGTVIFYIVNFFFVQRLVRAALPSFGWSKVMKLFPFVGVAVTISNLLMLITSLIQSFYTRDERILHIDRTLSLVGLTVNIVLAFLPIPLLTLVMCVLLYRKITGKITQIETIGTSGSFIQKVIFMVVVSAILTLGAGFRNGTFWVRPVSLTEERPWYFSKVCFYVFNLGLDAMVLVAYLVLRVDRLFWVPDGSTQAGQYDAGCIEARKSGFKKEVVEKEVV